MIARKTPAAELSKKKEYYRQNREAILLLRQETYRRNREAFKLYNRAYYLANKDRLAARNKPRSIKWAKDNPERMREIYRRSRKKHYAALTPEQKRQRCLKESERLKNVQREALTHYGGRCFCCGETEYLLLTLDHINGGGNRHRKDIGVAKGKMRLSDWAKRNNWPLMFQVACYNCNFGRYRNGGICPHRIPSLRGG